MEMCQERRTAEKKEERYDLFSSLLDNTEDEDGSANLTEDELLGEPGLMSSPHLALIDTLLGNIFIFLLAGNYLRCASGS